MKKFMKIAAVNVNAKKVRRMVCPVVDGQKMVDEVYKEAARFGWKIIIEDSERGYSAMIDEIERDLRV